MHKLVFILLFGLFSAGASAQDYIAYQNIINRADGDLLANNDRRALLRLDTLYDNYRFIYARHCMKALQLCCNNNDSMQAGKWLDRCFRQGVAMWMIRANEISRKALSYTNTKPLIQQYENLRAAYESSLNKELACQVDSLLKIDYHYTQKVNNGFILLRHTVYGLQWMHNNKREFKAINKMIAEYGYPGERLIGLPGFVTDSARGYKDFVENGPGVELQDRRVEFMLIHYFSTPRKDINDKLLPEVKNGNLPARYYAAFNDFMAQSQPKHYAYYNVWHKDNNEAHAADINTRRQQIGLESYIMQQKIDSLYYEGRKAKTLNKKVVME